MTVKPVIFKTKTKHDLHYPAVDCYVLVEDVYIGTVLYCYHLCSSAE